MANILAIFQPVHLKVFIAGTLAGAALHRHLSGAGISAGSDPAEIEHRQAGNDGDHRDPADVGKFCTADHGMAAVAVQKRYYQCSCLGALGLPGQDLANSSVAIVIGMVYDYLPFMILPVYNAVSELKEDIIEAARDLGAPPKCSADKNHDPADQAGNHQRNYHGVRSVTDYICHPGYSGRRQGDADRKYY